MKLDTSVAPEIALLAAGQDATAERRGPAGPGRAVRQAAPSGPATATPPTVGYLARSLRLLIADPQGLAGPGPVRPAPAGARPRAGARAGL